MSENFAAWLQSVPKAELHLHIDGSLQAHRLLSLAQKNNIELPYQSVEEVEAAYDFENLQSFLDLYYLGASVLIEEDDFYHLMMDYLLKCREQNIVHAEIMIEPQTYQPNGVRFETMMNGFHRAISEARQEWGQSTALILSFLRHLSEAEALETLQQAQPFKDQISAIGLASSELGNPPEKFINLYQQAKQDGYSLTAHAGEEGPPSYVWDALDKLEVSRIDHGVRSIEDPALMERLRQEQIALTVCPLSNIKLCVFEKMQDHNVLELLEAGLLVTINSDDPAYFGGYLNENFLAMQQDLDMSKTQALRLIENSFTASLLPEADKKTWLNKLSALA